MKRKIGILALVLAFALALSAGTAGTLAAQPLDTETTLRGDFNGDGAVTSDDALYLLRHTFKPEEYPIGQSGDVNGDKSFNSDDAVYLLRHTLNPGRYPLRSGGGGGNIVLPEIP